MIVTSIITPTRKGEFILNFSNEINYIISKFLQEYNGNKVGYRKMFLLLADVLKVATCDEITEQQFLIYFNYLSDKVTSRGLNGYIKFFHYLIINDYVKFINISERILYFKDIGVLLKQGYRVIRHNPFDEFPKESKLIIEFFSNDNTFKDNHGIYTLDLSTIRNKSIRDSFIYFIWNYSEKNSSKRQKDSYLKPFIEILDESHDINEFKIEINVNHITLYRQTVLNGLKSSSVSVALSRIRQFASFLSQSNLIIVNRSTFKYMRTFNTRSVGDTRKFSLNELQKIMNELDKIYNESSNVLYFLIKCAVKIQMSTPLRLKDILELKTDSIIEITKGVFIVNVASKKYDVQTFNLQSNIVAVVKSVIENTYVVRSKTRSKFSNHLFIYPREKGGNITVINTFTFSKIINEISNKLNIMELGQTGIRNYYQSKVTEYVLSTNKSEGMIKQLSGHSIMTHMNYYEGTDFYKLMGEEYNVEIGNLDFSKNVRVHYDSNGEDIVQNYCGYCSSSQCNNHTDFDCLLCKNFVATVTNIPLFEYEIEKISKLICEEEIQHEKEFYISKKRLLVRYLSELKSLKEEVKP